MVKAESAAGQNWEKLKTTLTTGESSTTAEKKKKRKAWLESNGRRNRGPNGVKAFLPSAADGSAEAGPSRPRVEVANPAAKEAVVFLEPPNDGPFLRELREMVAGQNILNEAKRAPGNYIAIDCEMVGIHEQGSESAVARVSLVNYHGHVLIDTFVQPREKVTDYRTWVSGVRASDLEGAPAFDTVQKQVAELVEGRVLVGHAIENDLKALLLSHPKPMVRDTQRCKPLRERAKTKFPGLRKLAAMELGLEIQKASHSSVTDARATMALYRLHKTAWEQSIRPTTEAFKAKLNKGKAKEEGGSSSSGKRKRGDDEGVEEADAGDGDDDDETDAKASSLPSKKGKKQRQEFPGGGRKGVSSGLSVVIRRGGKRIDGPRQRGVPRGSTGQSTGPVSAAGGSWWEEV